MLPDFAQECALSVVPESPETPAARHEERGATAVPRVLADPVSASDRLLV